MVPVTGSPNLIDFCVAYQQPGGLIANVYGFNNAPRWANCYLLYEEYAITGMKVKWIPGNINPTQDTQQTAESYFMGPMITFDDVDTYDTTQYTEQQYLQMDSMRVRDPKRVWKIYRSFKKLSQQEQLKWQDCAAYSSAAANTLSAGSFNVRFNQRLGISNRALGYFKITHYVTFRGSSLNG